MPLKIFGRTLHCWVIVISATRIAAQSERNLFGDIYAPLELKLKMEGVERMSPTWRFSTSDLRSKRRHSGPMGHFSSIMCGLTGITIIFFASGFARTKSYLIYGA